MTCEKKKNLLRKKIFSFKEKFELWEEKAGGDSFASVKRFEKLKKKNFKELNLKS